MTSRPPHTARLSYLFSSTIHFFFFSLLLTLPLRGPYAGISLTPQSLPPPIPVTIDVAPYPRPMGSEPPPLTARAAIAIDVDSAVILYEKNSREKLYPASTTKMMTSLVALENLPLGHVFTIGQIDAPPQKVYLLPGEQITLENLVYAALVASGNDAAEAIARGYPGGRSAFIAAMNTRAQQLHLVNTNFQNPTGIDEENHYSSSLDLARLAMFAIQNPTFSRIVSTPNASVFSLDGKIEHKFTNINQLLGTFDGVIGVKTGYTEKSGETLVALTKRGGHKIITVVIGSRDRFGESKSLIDWTFSNHEWVNPDRITYH